MTKIKLAFQGEKGAYSHIACKEIFKDAEVKNCKTFEETFKIAFDDESYKAIIPIENSSKHEKRHNNALDIRATILVSSRLHQVIYWLL